MLARVMISRQTLLHPINVTDLMFGGALAEIVDKQDRRMSNDN